VTRRSSLKSLKNSPAVSSLAALRGGRKLSRPFLQCVLAVLLPTCYCQTALAAGSGYWLRLDDLRMPRPASDERQPPKAKESPPPEGDQAPPEPSAEMADSPLRLGGNYKVLAAYSHTPDSANDAYTQVVGRLRVKMNYRFSPSLEAKVEHDTELTTGSYVRTDYFQSHKNDQTPQYWSEGSAWADRRNFYGAQRFFRAYVKWASDVADATVGRQRIPLGTGRFWSTIDMLNPINPLQIERDEFTGVDAALIERGIGALSKVSVVYAPDPARVSDRWVTQYRTNVKESDLTFTYGKYWGDHVVGADFVTQVGNAGVRGEAVYTRPEIGASYSKTLLGFDYAFANTLAFSAEAYYSDRSAVDRDAQWANNPQLGLVQPLGNAYLGLAVGYEFTPLLKVSTYILNNLKDNSGVLYPSLTYSLSDNISLMGGAQFFFGDADSEYGPGSDLYFARFQQFF
jgi:hypothetical protein